jgi:hypothetical protein
MAMVRRNPLTEDGAADAEDLRLIEHPFHRSPDFVAAIRTLIRQPRHSSIFGDS